MAKKLHFNVNAYTARLIGRENVSTLDGAILELVKNTYDADASKCILYYEPKDNILYLMDNGCGMTEEVIQKHWMTIGNSSKYSNFITTKGRIQTGAKGIGRFALDRVSDNCIMYTKNINEKDIIEWKVNWKDFDRKENLTDITADINYLTNQHIYDTIAFPNQDVNKMLNEHFKTTGTIFKITNLREEWNHDLIENIRKSLSSLIPPDIENEFNIYLYEGNQTTQEALIISQHIDAYDYKIEFEVDKNQNVTVKLHRNEYDFQNKFDEVMGKAGFSSEDREYFQGKKKIINTTITELLNMEIEDIGEFHGTLYFNKIMTTKDDIQRYFYKDIKGRKNYSDVFGGIKLYRDNFRIRPYGEKDSSSYDWLALGARGHGSPAISSKKGKWKVAVEQISGIVHISRMNIHLEDQSNRGGIIETAQFRALKETITEIISLFEEDRQSVAIKLLDLWNKEHPAEDKKKEIEEKAAKEKEQKEKQQQNATENEENINNEQFKVSASDAQDVIDEKQKQIEELEDENRMLRNLATSGIISNQCIHETKSSVDNIGIDIAATYAVLEDENIETAMRYLQNSKVHLKTLKSWFDVTIGSIKKDKRTRKFTDINPLIRNQIKLWKRVFPQDVTLKIDVDNDIGQVKCFPYEIESILNNLITNSLYAFDPDTTKEIIIYIHNIEDGIMIEYHDTGRGLAPGYKNNPYKILDALETDKRNSLGEKIGTGMGMWIIRNIVDDYGGNIDLEENRKSDIGFHIKIKMKMPKKEE